MNLVKHPLSFIDIETNGGSAQNGRVIEIGVVRVENSKVTDTFQTLIDPGDRIPQTITWLTGITNDDLESAPTFRNISDRLMGVIDGSIFVAHNAAFDYGFIKAELSRLGEVFDPPVLCTAKLSRALFPEHQRHNLDVLIERYGLEVKNRHRAMDDAEALWQFYKTLLMKFDLDTINGAAMKQFRPKKSKMGQKSSRI